MESDARQWNRRTLLHRRRASLRKIPGLGTHRSLHPCEIPTVIIVSYGRAPESCSFASCHNLLPCGPGTKHLTAKVAKGREGRRENRFGDLLCGFEYFVGFAVK